MLHFDPRNIPALGIDSHLPAVTAESLLPIALRRRFENLPNWDPEVTVENRWVERESQHASVLVPIVMRHAPTILLTERAQHLSNHSGQVAFPGGKVDEDDVDASATALREAQEELGLDPGLVEVLGVLPQYVTGSAFIITPVVGLVESHYSVNPNRGEVADVFEVPLHFLMNPAHHQRHAFEWQGVRREWFSIPYQDRLTQRFIWGATAGILRNLYRLLSV